MGGMALSIKSHEINGKLHLLIEDEMTIYTAAELKDELFGFLDTTQALEIDLSAVSEIDSAGLQILLLIKREADTQDKSVTLINHNQAVLEVYELLNVAGYFGDPVVIPAEWRK
jgi:anti-anti-sigma factor